MRLAGLGAAYDADNKANPALDQNWLTVQDWSERSRYERHSLGKAQRMIEAVTDQANGVLPWIKAHW
jgi:hypothetical protein